MKPTVCLLTAYNSQYEDFAGISLRQMAALADAHDYEFRAVRRNDCERKGGWMKIEPILATLAENFDYVLWMDIDALVVRKDQDIRDELRDDIDLQMVWHGPDTSRLEIDPFLPHFNSGVMLIRNTAWARQFFARVWNIGPVNHFWNDQATILHLLGYDGLLGLGCDDLENTNRLHVARLDNRWNSIVGVAVAPDPIVHHYAGIGSTARLRLMQADQRTLDVRTAAGPEVRDAFAWQLGQWRNDVVPSQAAPVPLSLRHRSLRSLIGLFGL